MVCQEWHKESRQRRDRLRTQAAQRVTQAAERRNWSPISRWGMHLASLRTPPPSRTRVRAVERLANATRVAAERREVATEAAEATSGFTVGRPPFSAPLPSRAPTFPEAGAYAATAPTARRWASSSSSSSPNGRI